MECCYPVCEDYAVAPMLIPPCCAKKYCVMESPCPRLPRCPKPVSYTCEPKPEKPMYYLCEAKPKPREYDCCDPPPRKGCCDPSPRKPCHDPCQNPCPPPDYCKSCCYEPQPCKPVKTKYIMPCYRYEDGRIVRRLPVSAFKRNGMQDQEHSKIGTANFLVRHPRDVAVECEVRTDECVKVCKPAKVPPLCTNHGLCNSRLKKKPIESNQPTVLMRRACEVACGTRKRKPFVVSSYAADPHNEIRRYHSEDVRGNCCFHFERKKPCVSCDPCCVPCEPCPPWQAPAPAQCHECQYVDCVYSHPTAPSCCYY